MARRLELERQYFELLHRTKPRDSFALFALASIQAKTGNEPEADRYLRRAHAALDRELLPRLALWSVASVGVASAIAVEFHTASALTIPFALIGPIVWLFVRWWLRTTRIILALAFVESVAGVVDLPAEIEKMTIELKDEVEENP